MSQIVADPTGKHIIPTTTQSLRPTDEYGSDRYISSLQYLQTPSIAVDTFMPLHLADELAPRFAKHKLENLWRARKDATARAREQVGKDAIAEWELNGRDRNLRRVMDLDDVGLEGVPIRPRSKREVEEIALREFDANQIERKRQLAYRRDVLGLKWDYDLGGWVEGPRALELLRKREAKEKRLLKKAKGLRELKLEPKKNMVVPEWLRKSAAESTASS
jgi:large subunit ribosomal protein L24